MCLTLNDLNGTGIFTHLKNTAEASHRIGVEQEILRKHLGSHAKAMLSLMSFLSVEGVFTR
jgi:hypothetical protein